MQVSKTLCSKWVGKRGSCGSSKGALELNDEQCCKQTKKVKEKKENRVCKISSTWSRFPQQQGLLSSDHFEKNIITLLEALSFS